MTTRKAAIQTVYQGITYRSMLEARWSAFFIMMGANMLYEPFELLGYIPDFVSRDTNILFEVKPIVSSREKTSDVSDKIKKSGWQKPFVILGAYWHLSPKIVPGLSALNLGVGSLRTEWRDPGTGLLVPVSIHNRAQFNLFTGEVYPRGTKWENITPRAVKKVDTFWNRAHSLTRWSKK